MKLCNFLIFIIKKTCKKNAKILQIFCKKAANILSKNYVKILLSKGEKTFDGIR